MGTPKPTDPPAAAEKKPPRLKSPGLKPRLSIPLTDAGGFAVDVMTPSVRDRLARAVADPELRLKLALEPAAAAAPAPAIDPWPADVSGALYELLGRILAAVARRYQYTPAQSAALLFTDDEKQQLAAPTCAVLDKYFPGGLGRYGPEFVLAGAVLTVAQQKIAALHAAAPARPAATVSQFPPAPGTAS